MELGDDELTEEVMEKLREAKVTIPLGKSGWRVPFVVSKASVGSGGPREAGVTQ